MFSDRSHFAEEQQALISGLMPMSDEAVKGAVGAAQSVPSSYTKFLTNFGSGKIKPPNEPDRFPAHFEILERLRSAEKEYFQDTKIYEHGAKGDVLIFGTESTGICYGFDSGNNNAVVQIDNYRIVQNLDLDFEQLIFGIIACYPDFPESYGNGLWTNDLGDKFSIAGRP
jgi:hypothetical protein